MRLTGSLQSRLLLGAAAWGLLALAVTGLLLFLLFRDHLEAQVRERLEDDSTQLLAHTDADAQGLPTLTQALSDPLYRRVYSGHYWQVERDGEILGRSRSLWDQTLSVPVGASESAYRYATGPRGRPLLVLARSVTLPRVPGTLWVLVATDLLAVDAALRRFALVLGLGLGVLALGLVLAAVLQVRLGLRPLRRMRRGLAAIRAGAAARLDGSYPQEVAPLADDFNAVLEDNDGLIRRARSQAGNLAHALKTPLSVMINDADALTRHGHPDLGRRLLHELETMQRQIDWHLANARIAALRRPGLRTEVAQTADRLARTLRRLYAPAVDTDIPHGLYFAGEREDLEQMLGNLMDNACKWAASCVHVDAGIADGRLRITVSDDGPGLTPAARQHVLARGRRLDETQPGAGLGLAIVADLAALYGGGLALEAAPGGGLAAVLTLPCM